MHRIACGYRIPEEAAKVAEGRAEFVWPDKTGDENAWSKDKLIEMIQGCEGLLDHGYKIDGAMMDAMPSVKAIAHVGAGYEKIDAAAATERGICVCNTPRAVINPTSEMTIMIMLDMLRHHTLFQEKAKKELTFGMPLYPVGPQSAEDKVLGIVGFGGIGKEVARKAKAFGMKIIYSDPVRAPKEIEDEIGAKFVSFEELLRTADVVSVHCPYTKENWHLIAKPQFDMMKDGSYIVNAARGPIVCEADMIAALKSGKLAGAAADVYEFEPNITPELAQIPNMIIAPHIGTQCGDARIKMTQEALLGLLDCLDGKRPHNLVNPQVLK